MPNADPPRNPSDDAEPPITPPPVPRDAAAVLLFGGSFDPPHRAHTELPTLARAALEKQLGKPVWLLYVPAARSPHKQGAPTASNEHRLAMLRLATQDLPRAAVWTDELDRADPDNPAPSYTTETTRRARAALGEAVTLRLLIGADQAVTFHRWKDPRGITENAAPLVMLRAPAESPDLLIEKMRAADAWSEQELRDWRGRVIKLPLVDVSATALRDALSANRDSEDDALEQLLHPEVARYIRERGLYRK